MEDNAVGLGSVSHYECLQKKIKDAGLQDFKQWVQGQSEEMEKANVRGDTKKIYRVVKTLTSKNKKSSSNITTDDEDNLLGCVTDVANR